MPPLQKNLITQLLRAWSGGDQGAFDQLLPIIYNQLHQIAELRLRRERPHHTLQPTALINEAYLNLVGRSKVSWQNRAHFFAVASAEMRSILVDYARRQRAAKRGGTVAKVTLNEGHAASEGREFELIEFNLALSKFEKFDPDSTKIVVMRFFGGLSVEEVAAVLELSASTVKRRWEWSRAWLRREIYG